MRDFNLIVFYDFCSYPCWSPAANHWLALRGSAERKPEFLIVAFVVGPPEFVGVVEPSAEILEGFWRQAEVHVIVWTAHSEAERKKEMFVISSRGLDSGVCVLLTWHMLSPAGGPRRYSLLCSAQRVKSCSLWAGGRQWPHRPTCRTSRTVTERTCLKWNHVKALC